MTAIKKKAIELIMNLPDAEIRAILEKYELTKPDSTAKSKRLTTTPLYTKQALSRKTEGLRFMRNS